MGPNPVNNLLDCYKFFGLAPSASKVDIKRAFNSIHNARADAYIRLEKWALQNVPTSVERLREHRDIVTSIGYWEQQYQIGEACYAALVDGKAFIPPTIEPLARVQPQFIVHEPYIKLDWVTSNPNVQERILQTEHEFKMVGDACDQFRYQLIRWGKYRRRSQTLTDVQLWEVAAALTYNDSDDIHGIQVVREMFPGTEHYSEEERDRLWHEFLTRVK